MLIRDHTLFAHYEGPAPSETLAIENDGHAVARGVFTEAEISALREEILEVYANYPGDPRGGIPDAEQVEMYRYQMFNKSALCQKAIGHPRILAALEPLLGSDCHVINCTSWKNPPGLAKEPQAFYWHIDGGPYVPRPVDTEWPESIPYPVFVVATHIYLEPCDLDDGPTSAIPGSHKSGQAPPKDRCTEYAIDYRGRGPESHIVAAGDVGFFVSDVWHRRRLPTEKSKGRFFLQTNYGRRDIAPRNLTPPETCQANQAARDRAKTLREQTLIGLHPHGFYDG